MKVASLLLALAAVLTCLTACGAQPPQTLVITGDCEGYSAVQNAPLEALIELAQPRAAQFDVLLVGADGLASRMPGGELAGCELVYSRENAWELRTEDHPPSARVKNLAQIVVVSAADDPKAAHFIEGDSAAALTAGQLYLRGQRVLQERGTSQRNGRSVTVYTTQVRLPLSELLPGAGQFCAVGFDGKTRYFRGTDGCFLESNQNRMDLLLPGGQTVEGLAGVLADPPGFLITEAYHDALHFLEQGERVLVIELDGLGWAMLEAADAPYLKSLHPQKALACYPPISPVGLAAMLTGETPDVHGVHDRENRALACGDLFAKEKASAYIEGSHTLLQTSLQPVLSINDNEVFKNTQKALENSPNLLFSHFHEIDETAHECGPLARQTLEKIAEIDGLVRALCEGFGGRVILTADHGLHEAVDGGTHGAFLLEDMAVPYVIR